LIQTTGKAYRKAKQQILKLSIDFASIDTTPVDYNKT
jgi:hypothetical protein